MRIRILGSAAGGGVPQWNCNCRNCRDARRASQRRTQSSVAVSADSRRWVLLNASPDLTAQFAAFPPLAPRGKNLRGSALEAVVLTDGELDHVAGLLSLREAGTIRIVCTAAVRDLLAKRLPLLRALREYCDITASDFPCEIAGLRFTALNLADKPPRYARRRGRRGDTVGLRIEDARRKRALAYFPCVPAITEKITRFVADCDCLLVDGTFWSGDEMTARGLSTRNAKTMGHVPVDGADGSLEWLRGLRVRRKIFVHINNTNPILRDGSRERHAVELAGVEIAFDGMDIRL